MLLGLGHSVRDCSTCPMALIVCSYAAHHAKRVEVIAATDDQLQFELDTTAAEGRQVMLQNPAGASAMKVCWIWPAGFVPADVQPSAPLSLKAT